MSEKKNRKGSLLLVAALLLTCGAAGTIAKYQTTLTGSDTATVASFNVTSNKLDKTSTKDIELFNTINEEDTTSTESDVASGKIAPGTGGSTEITITNDSDVKIGSKLSFTLTNNGLNVPLEFSVDKSTWKKDITGLNDVATVTQGMSSGDKTRTVTLYWRWNFIDDDVADTTIGESTDLNNVSNQPKVTVSMEATQID